MPRLPQLPGGVHREQPVLRHAASEAVGAAADLDVGRRRFLLTVAASAAVAPVMRVAGSGFERSSHDAIRPPGALDEEAFLSRCITCGACSASCPTGVIVSDFGKTGLNGLFTPVLDMRRGWCEPSCIRCGEVCPTSALRLLEPEAKQTIGEPAEVTIGTAFMDRGRCLPWAMNTPCIVCEEMCPTSPKAIVFETVHGTDTDGKQSSYSGRSSYPNCAPVAACVKTAVLWVARPRFGFRQWGRAAIRGIRCCSAGPARPWSKKEAEERTWQQKNRRSSFRWCG